MLLIAFAIILLSILIYQRHQRMSIFERLGILGPKPNLMIGNWYDIAKDGLVGVFPKWTTKYGPIVGFYLGGQPQVLITDLELIKLVMIRDFDIFSKSINVMDVTSSFGFLSNF